MAYNNI